MAENKKRTIEEFDEQIKELRQSLPTETLEAMDSVWVYTGLHPVYNVAVVERHLAEMSTDIKATAVYLVCVLHASKNDLIVEKLLDLLDDEEPKAQTLLHILGETPQVGCGFSPESPTPRATVGIAERLAEKAMVMTDSAINAGSVTYSNGSSGGGGSDGMSSGEYVAAAVGLVAVGSLAYYIMTGKTPLSLLNNVFCGNNNFKIS